MEEKEKNIIDIYTKRKTQKQHGVKLLLRRTGMLI